MNKNVLKVSIITTTNNSEKTILDCVKSVAIQNYLNIEHIFIQNLKNK